MTAAAVAALASLPSEWVLEVRPATVDDLDDLARFERAIAEVSFGDEAITDEGFHRERLRRAMAADPGGMFVLAEGPEVLGFTWMRARTNSATGESYVDFRSFYVDERARGNEAVDRLFEAGMSWARSRARLIVGRVHATNLPMRVLYRKYGFEPTHITMERREPGGS